MSSTRYRAAVSVALFVLMAAPLSADTHSDANAAGFDADRLARIEHFVDEEIEAKRIAGAVTLVARNGVVVHRHVAGYQDAADRRPLRSDTIFQIYSMTKPVIGAAVMILVEEGVLKLDDPVSNYIPGFADLRVYVSGEGDDMVTKELARPVTVQHLATHMAGFTSFGDSPLNQYLATRYQRPDRFPSLEAYVDHLLPFPLLFQPGSEWKYGPSFDILGHLIEVVSGEKLQTFLQQRLFGPLGMTDTGFSVPASKVDRLASRHASYDGAISVIERSAESPKLDASITPSGGGGLVSTANDYLRFAQMVLNGGELDGVRILSPASVRMMTANHLPAGMESYPGEGYGIGFGVDLNMARKGTLGNAGSYHWLGNDRTHFWVDPKARIIGLFLTQAQPFSFDYGKDMRNLTYQALMTE